jgi:[protein-PII] uridylyltransferase
MPDLRERIEANAAKRLPAAAETVPAADLQRAYKTFLKVETHRLKLLHRAGAGGLRIAQGRAAVLDAVLRHCFEAVRARTPAVQGAAPPRIALVATGGYGRGELNPISDIDILLLHDVEGFAAARGRLPPLLAALTGPGGLIYTLYDIGLKVGSSVRTVEDCVKAAGEDIQSKTALIEARLITGDAELFKRMQAVVLTRCIRGFEDDYIAARVADQASRRTKLGNSPLLQEPNIKNGCGGLRDYQNLLWMAFVKYRTRSLDDLRERELISATESKQLTTAYDFLLRARTELHYLSNRAADVLTKSVQPQVAHGLGYHDRSQSRRLERFMRDYYAHARNIDLITRTVEQRLALLPEPRRLPSIRDLLLTGRRRVREQVADGFRFVDGVLYADTPRIFKDDRARLMRVFFHCQHRNLRLHPDLAARIRHDLNVLVDAAFLRDEHVRTTFLELLRQRGNVAPILRVMHETGFLGRYLPEFGRLTCLVQHEFYHQYTADEHTLMCVEKLDQLWHAAKPPLGSYAEIFREIEHPEVLYLALLLHDAGKAADNGDHASAGARLAQRVARRLGLDGITSHTLAFLVEHHLAMAQLSQRRDLDDASVVSHFAGLVQSRETLSMLTLHTIADSLGTSDKLWNGFKDTLLLTLHHRAREALAGGSEFLRAEARQRKRLAEEVRELVDGRINDEEFAAHFDNLPPRYFLIHTAADIAADLGLAHRFMARQLEVEEKALEPVVHWRDEPDRACSTVKVCTFDRAGLFSKVAGSLTAAGLNILSAQVFTRADGVVLDTFHVTDARAGSLVARDSREKFEATLGRALTEPVDLRPLIARQRAAAPSLHPWEGERIPTTVRFDNDISDSRTVLDIEAEDRVGLLHAVSQALSELGLDISLAKINTEKGAAVDTFYVTEVDGRKITFVERQHAIEAKLRAAISSLDGE